MHRASIVSWKRQAIDGIAGTLFGAGDVTKAASESEVEKLHTKIRQLVVARNFFSVSFRSMSVERKRAMVEPAHQRLSISAQCRLLRISRSYYFYVPVPETDETLALMTVIDTDNPRLTLHEADVRFSMGARGRWMDNALIERPWRSRKFESAYLHAFETDTKLLAGLGRWITDYNTQRPHSGLAGGAPVEAYRRIGQSDHGGHNDKRD